MQLKRDRIRIAFDNQSERPAKDVITSATPLAWLKTSFQIEMLFSFEGTILNIANLQTISVTLARLNDRSNLLLPPKEIGQDKMTFEVAAEEWAANTAQHCIVQFSAAETDFDIGNKTEEVFWLEVGTVTDEGEPFILGYTQLTLRANTRNATISPPRGPSLVPVGQTYGGTGTYVLTTVPNKLYSVTLGDNDTDLVNGTETVDASGFFEAQGASVTLRGTVNALITTIVRSVDFVTEERMRAYAAGFLRVVNAPGVNVCVTSPNGKWLGEIGIGDDGIIFMNPRQLEP